MTTVPLAEVAEINPRSPMVAGDEIVSFVGMAQLDAVTAEAGFGEDKKFSEVNKGYTVFADGDILLAKITPCFENNKIGQARLDRKIGVGSTEFHVLRPSDRLHDRYLLHFLRQSSVRRRGEMRMTGSAGQRRVPVAFLQALQIPLPPLNRQRRIAAILDHADDLRAKQRNVIAKLDSLTSAIFAAEFCAGPSRRRWPTVSLGDVVPTIDSGTSPVCETRKASDGEWGVLKLGAISYGTFNAEENKAFLGDPASIRRVEVQPGDLLFSRKNTKELVGATAIAYGAPPRLLLPDLIFRLNIDRERVEAEFLHGLLRSPRTRPAVVALASGSASSMSNISKARLVALPIELPPIEMQHAYSDRVRAVTALRDQASRVLVKLDDLLTSLQARAFSGQL